MEKGMSDACVTQLVRAVDRQSKDPARIPGQLEASLFAQKDSKLFENLKIKFFCIPIS